MADANIQKIEADALFYASMSCLPAVKQAYRYFYAQGKTEEDFDRCAAEALAKAVRHAVQLTAREVKDPVWPYALAPSASLPQQETKLLHGMTATATPIYGPHGELSGFIKGTVKAEGEAALGDLVRLSEEMGEEL